ncbi:hypothetical protein [Mycobacterium sp. 94-17]|uniref:hypothetical protein n=1 Tax=Mycobacterium sp. 94-17 TaxID=2986147 RepID=UPI002D1F251F|nr:hypothetical protein [Mycobacterium sp. 94-17]MEB4211429.1 hypothetical protein [Mycobacterium sp. 94-17]
MTARTDGTRRRCPARYTQIEPNSPSEQALKILASWSLEAAAAPDSGRADTTAVE